MTKALVAVSTFFAIVLTFSQVNLALAEKPAELTDAEIAHVAYIADLIDIRYAHLALGISQNPAVREFAETMIRDHEAVNEAALDLVGKLGVAPQDNFLSRQLNAQADQLVDELRQLTGAAFDRRYAENELGYHRAVNSLVEGTFTQHRKRRSKGALRAGPGDLQDARRARATDVRHPSGRSGLRLNYAQASHNCLERWPPLRPPLSSVPPPRLWTRPRPRPGAISSKFATSNFPERALGRAGGHCPLDQPRSGSAHRYRGRRDLGFGVSCGRRGMADRRHPGYERRLRLPLSPEDDGAPSHRHELALTPHRALEPLTTKGTRNA